jgi:hypothetical protein
MFDPPYPAKYCLSPIKVGRRVKSSTVLSAAPLPFVTSVYKPVRGAANELGVLVAGAE